MSTNCLAFGPYETPAKSCAKIAIWNKEIDTVNKIFILLISFLWKYYGLTMN